MYQFPPMAGCEAEACYMIGAYMLCTRALREHSQITQCIDCSVLIWGFGEIFITSVSLHSICPGCLATYSSLI